MLTVNQDYIIINSDTPVLTRQANGQFELKNCYFLEFFIESTNTAKIETVCQPFDFGIAVKYAISKYGYITNDTQRLFLLAGPDIINKDFTDSNEHLALALCQDGPKSTVIQYFEVNRNFRHSYEPNQKYRKVGTSALNALKEVYQTRELCGRSALEAIPFWLKNGFTRIDNREQYLHCKQR